MHNSARCPRRIDFSSAIIGPRAGCQCSARGDVDRNFSGTEMGCRALGLCTPDSVFSASLLTLNVIEFTPRSALLALPRNSPTFCRAVPHFVLVVSVRLEGIWRCSFPTLQPLDVIATSVHARTPLRAPCAAGTAVVEARARFGVLRRRFAGPRLSDIVVGGRRKRPFARSAVLSARERGPSWPEIPGVSLSDDAGRSGFGTWRRRITSSDAESSIDASGRQIPPSFRAGRLAAACECVARRDEHCWAAPSCRFTRQGTN
jgi:hypothetical protein